MQRSECLLADMSTAFAAAFTKSFFALIDDARSGLLTYLREFYATFGVAAWREFSRMFQDALRHPGTRVLNDHLVWLVLVVSLIVGAIALVVLWRMLWTGIRVDKAAFKVIDKNVPRSVNALRYAIIRYLGALAGSLLEGAILFLCVWVLTTVLFIIPKILWFSYLASPVGRLYPHYFPYRSQLISMVLGQDLVLFPLVLTVIAFGTGIVFSAICRFFHLTRYIFLPRGVLGRVVLLALPLNAATAAAVRIIFPHPHWGAAFVATLIPILLSFSYCFRFTNRFLPELGILFYGFKHKADSPMHIILLRDLKTGNKVVAFDPLAGRLTGRRFPAQDGVQIQGQLLVRRGHELILYRYGRDLFFQVDNLELPLHADMSVNLLEKGRFVRCVELSRDGNRLFRLVWTVFPLFGAQSPTAIFFDTLEGILQHHEAYENAFIIGDDPELSE